MGSQLWLWKESVIAGSWTARQAAGQPALFVILALKHCWDESLSQPQPLKTHTQTHTPPYAMLWAHATALLWLKGDSNYHITDLCTGGWNWATWISDDVNVFTFRCATEKDPASAVEQKEGDRKCGVSSILAVRMEQKSHASTLIAPIHHNARWGRPALFNQHSLPKTYCSLSLWGALHRLDSSLTSSSAQRKQIGWKCTVFVISWHVAYFPPRPVTP